MDESARRRQGRSFGSVADVYERSRPGYPDAAVRWLVGTDGPARVVDLAAGTGKLTETLVEQGHFVVAVEPSAAMIDKLTRRIRRGVAAVQATAEAIPLRTARADALVVGQAFHWFDYGPALHEIARVVKTGGMFGLVWNQRDESVPWVRRLSRILAVGAGDRSEGAVDAVDDSRLFRDIEVAEFRLWQRLDKDSLLALASSRSYVATLPPGDRQEILAKVGRLYDVTARQPDGLVLPYKTMCYRAEVR
jgi:SAM-dependent methyltransferase